MASDCVNLISKVNRATTDRSHIGALVYDIKGPFVVAFLKSHNKRALRLGPQILYHVLSSMSIGHVMRQLMFWQDLQNMSWSRPGLLMSLR